jgi:hypothetical protein
VDEQDDDQISREAATADEEPTIKLPVPPSWPPLVLRTSLPIEPVATSGAWRKTPFRVKRMRAIVLGVLAVCALMSGTLLALGAAGHGAAGLIGSVGPVAARATATSLPTPTATLVPLPDFSLPSFCNAANGASPPPDCVHCPYTYGNTSYTHAQVQEALDAAAEQYALPRALLYAVAWGESNWNSGTITCNYDLGVMQLKQGYLATFDNFNEPAGWCPGVQRTLYDPVRSMQENVLLGAKWLAWLRCYYGWMASSGGSQAAPDHDTLAWYYRQAGTPLPDTSAPGSLCLSTAQDSSKPWFKDLGADATNLWSCPFSAKAGDRTFLDVVLAGYNGGPQALDGSIPNDGYVSYIEGIMTQFAQGQLPQ